MSEAEAAPGPSVITVDASASGTRLDVFVGRAVGSAGAARRLIGAGSVLLDGRPAAKGARVSEGQVVEVRREADGAVAVPPDTSLPLLVLYEDADLVAINKPGGVPTHPVRPGERGTVAGALVARYPECAAASLDPREAGLAHRLDVGTSGVLLAARSREAWLGLRGALKAPGCEKTYLVEVQGVPPAATIVTAPIGRVGRRAGRVRVGRGRGLLPARTDVRLLERRGLTSIVQAQLAIGRPHQVRAHLAHLGCPVVGDDVYGDAKGGEALHLHAFRVAFAHPRTGSRTVIEAPAPPWAGGAPAALTR